MLANPVVETCRRVSEPYKKANRKFHPDDTRGRCRRREDRRRQLRRHRRPLLAWRARSRSSTCAQARQGMQALPCCAAAPSSPAPPPTPSRACGAEGLDLLQAGPAARPGLPIVTEIMNTEHLPLFDECGPHPGGRPQHAELRAAQGSWAARKSPCCSSAAWPTRWRNLLMSAEYIMAERQRERYPLRARHPHL